MLPNLQVRLPWKMPLESSKNLKKFSKKLGTLLYHFAKGFIDILYSFYMAWCRHKDDHFPRDLIQWAYVMHTN